MKHDGTTQRRKRKRLKRVALEHFGKIRGRRIDDPEILNHKATTETTDERGKLPFSSLRSSVVVHCLATKFKELLEGDSFFLVFTDATLQETDFAVCLKSGGGGEA